LISNEAKEKVHLPFKANAKSGVIGKGLRILLACIEKNSHGQQLAKNCLYPPCLLPIIIYTRNAYENKQKNEANPMRKRPVDLRKSRSVGGWWPTEKRLF